MTDIKQTKLSTVNEFLEETGFGKKLMPGDVVIIRAVYIVRARSDGHAEPIPGDVVIIRAV